MNQYVVYILECADGTYYTGITTDIERRLSQHNNGTASKYTRVRRPVKLLTTTPAILTRAEASRLELQVKALPREAKVDFVTGYCK